MTFELLLVLALAVTGDSPPLARISGPERIAMGDLCVLDGSESLGTGHVWRLVGSVKTALPVDEGRRLVFASGTPGRYTFILAVADAGNASLAEHVVEVATPEPPRPQPDPPTPPAPPPDPAPSPRPPVPPPAPNPPPEPPAGRFDLARFSRSSAATVQLEPGVRRSTARSLASAHRSLAAAIRAGAMTDFANILEQRRAACRQAIGAYESAWSTWSQDMARRLGALHDERKLRTPADFADAFDEIAAGLEAI